MDLRGHGASEYPDDGDLSVRSMGRDIAAVLEAVAPERRVIVVGHSMGAIAALAMTGVAVAAFIGVGRPDGANGGSGVFLSRCDGHANRLCVGQWRAGFIGGRGGPEARGGRAGAIVACDGASA